VVDRGRFGEVTYKKEARVKNCLNSRKTKMKEEKGRVDRRPSVKRRVRGKKPRQGLERAPGEKTSTERTWILNKEPLP